MKTSHQIGMWFPLFGMQILLFALIGLIVVVDRVEPGITSEIHSRLKDSGVVDWLQSYVVPAWRTQEEQLRDNGRKSMLVPYNLVILFSLSYTALAMIAMFFYRRTIRLYMRNKIKELENENEDDNSYPIKLFLSLGAVFGLLVYVLYFMKFDFSGRTMRGLHPDVSGVFFGGWMISGMLISSYSCIFMILELNGMAKSKNGNGTDR